MTADEAGFLADTIVTLHAIIVLCVVLPVPLFIIGGIKGWRWVRLLWVRLTHLALIGFIVINTLLGNACPLTIWESALREKAGQVTYTGDFIAYWLHRLIYFSAPPYVFTIVYTLFGLLVVVIWWRWPPRMRAAAR